MRKVYIVTKSYDTYKGIDSDIVGVFAKEKKAKSLAKEMFEDIKFDYLEDPMGEVEIYESEDGDYFSIHDNDCSHSISVSGYNIE